MNPAPARRGQSSAVALVVVVALAAVAAATAFVLLFPRNRDCEPPLPIDAPLEPPVHSFALTASDAKETGEAPALAGDPAGNVFLAWASRTGENERSLFVAGFAHTDVRPVPDLVATSAVFKAVSQSKGKTMAHEVKMAPHLAWADRTMQLAWTEALPNGAGVRSVVAANLDVGFQFGAPVAFHDGSGSRATYTALAAGPNGALLAAWLDNRNGSQQCFAAERKPGAAAFETALQVHAGEPGKGVCPCCPTAALVGPDGTLYVAFRNVSNGFRDICVGVKKPGAAAFEVVPVVPPTWAFNGCPHDGPALARVGDTLHVAWMDARTNTQRCYLASAKMSDMKFTARELNADGPGSQGNPQLFADAAGTLHAVWEESLGADAPAPAAHAGHDHGAAQPVAGAGGRAIVYRALANGEFGPARAVAPKLGAFQSRPAITGTRGEIVVAWNELDESGKTVSVTRLHTGAGR